MPTAFTLLQPRFIKVGRKSGLFIEYQNYSAKEGTEGG
jgi:hypothetical protein